MTVQLIENFVHLDVTTLLEVIPFQQKSIIVFGKTHPQPRLTAWFGPCAYTYSHLTWEPQELPERLLEVKSAVEEYCECEFPTMLANLYRDGNDKVGWHSDDEPLFGSDPIIASLSFGAARDFILRRKDDHSVKEKFKLTHGSLLVMPKGTQTAWEHCLPKRKRVSEPRINFTFRPLG